MNRTVLLGDIAELKGGYAFKSKEYTDSGHFVLRTININSGGGLDRNGAVYISEENAKRYDRFQLQELDTLFVMVGATLGKTGIVRRKDLPALLNQNMWVIRAKKSLVDPLYLYYLFSIKSKDLLGYSSGAARDFVRRDDFRKLPLVIPELEEQKRVAGVIGAIDEKIDLNRKMNETLEQTGQALFRHHFIDNPEVANWDRVELGNYLKIERGLSYKGAFLSEDSSDVPMINLGSFALDGSYNDDNLKYYNGEFKERSVVRGGNLVVANTDMTQERVVLGSVISVPELNDIILFTHHVYGLRELKLPEEFIYYLLKRPQFRERAHGFATGTTVLFMPKEAITKLLFKLPDDHTMRTFTDTVKSIFVKREVIRKEIKTLITLRDTLLPRLISGKLKLD